jgi:hypothetical protein
VDPPERPVPWELQATRQARAATARRRQRRRLVIVSIAAIVSLTIIGAAAGVVVAMHESDDLPRRAVAPPSTTSTTVPLAEECRTPLTFDDPLRLWIGGDSLAGSLGPALGEQTADTGVVLPTYDARTSSGLSNPNFFDWPQQATAEMTRLDPEVVVFVIGANDFQVPQDDSVDDLGAPAWRAEYTRLIEEMLGLFEGDGRHVYWVGPPIMREKHKGDGAKEIDELMREVVARHPDVNYIDEYTLFSDENGEYTDDLPGTDGKDVRVRTDDGIHLTTAGSEFLADQVFTLIDRRCRILDQAIEGRKQPVRRAPGSSANGEGPSTGSTRATTPFVAPTTSSTGAPAPTSSSSTSPPTSTP